MNINSLTAPVVAASHRIQATVTALLAAAVSVRFSRTNPRRRTFGEKVRASRLVAWLTTRVAATGRTLLAGAAMPCVVGAALAVVTAACGSTSTSASASAQPASASATAQPAATQAPSSAQPTQAEPSGAPPAQANGSLGARAAPDVPGVQAHFFFPDDEGKILNDPDCLHGETYAASGATTSRWTTTLCRTPDPFYPGYTRYYGYDSGRDQWVATIAQASDGYVYEQNRWSLADGNVWFRYPASNPSAIEISVTPISQTTLNGFVPMTTYNQTDPKSGAREAYRMAVARAAMLVMELQAFNISGSPPYTAGQISAAESQAGVPGVLENISRPTFERILATDPVDTMES